MIRQIGVILILVLKFTSADEYRLPKSVIPRKYILGLTIDRNFYTTRKFEADIRINLDVLNQTQEIKLHAKNLNIFFLNLLRPGETLVNTNTSKSDPKTDIFTITTNEILLPGDYYLNGSYEGVIYSASDLYGLYKSTYLNNQQEVQFLAATQLGITDARTMLPCFDEPEMKATFDVSVQHPEGYSVISNAMPSENSELNIIHFEETPPMATYILALVVSNFTCDSVIADDIKFSVCSRPESNTDRLLALELAPKIVKVLEDFTAIQYNVSGLKKIDLVAVPDFSYGAMENWGIITFREAALLWNAQYSSNSNKHQVATVVAHELAHMWFGNLVTTRWWSDTFLNEGMAKYFEYFALAEVLDEWELDKFFVIEVLHVALEADSTETSLPLSSPVSIQAEISARFDSISYNKGASIIRMLAHTMGLENFQKGIQTYLDLYKFNNTLADNLWSSLQEYNQEPHSLEDVAKNWTYYGGYPTLNVEKNDSDVIVTQFGRNGTKWFIPITYTTSRNVSTAVIWLTPNNDSVKISNIIRNNSDWILLNNLQTGYYRVNYDNDLWTRIKFALQNDYTAINVINRAQIIDNLFYFALNRTITYSRVFEIIDFLKNDTEYYSWNTAFTGFSKLLPKITTPSIRQNLNEYVLQLMQKLYESTPISTEDVTNQIYTLKQAMVVNWACKLGHSDCIQHSREIFTADKNGVSSRKNLMSTVYCTALLHSNNTEEDFNYLWQKFQRSNVASQQEQILSILGCTENKTTLAKYFQLALTNGSDIRRQNLNTVLYSVIQQNSGGTDAALQYLIDNYEKIYNYSGDEQIIRTLISLIVSTITKQEQIDQLSELVQSGKLSIELEIATNFLLEFASDNLIKNKNLEEELVDYFKEKSNSSPRANFEHYYLILALCLFFHKFFYSY